MDPGFMQAFFLFRISGDTAFFAAMHGLGALSVKFSVADKG